MILSLSPPATAEPEGRHDIETHLKTHLSLRFHLDLLPDPANDPSTLSTNTHLERKIPVPVAISRLNKSPMSSPLGYSSSPLSPIPHTPLSGQIESKIPDPLKVVRLFTASYSNPTSIESKSSDSNRFKVDQKPLDPSRTPELESDAQLKIQVDQTADQWLVVWEACCKVEGSTSTGKLSLSCVVSYHPVPSQDLNSHPSILPTRPLSDSPPNFGIPQRPWGGGSDSGFGHAMEIDLFDGMGRDLSVSLTRPIVRSANSSSVRQSLGILGAGQTSRPGPPLSRLSQTYFCSQNSHGFANPSRSAEHLSNFPEERSQSAPAYSSIPTRRSASSGHPPQSSSARASRPDVNPGACSPAAIDRPISALIPIINPILLRVETIAPKNHLSSWVSATQPPYYPGVRFVTMDESPHPMLMVELSRPQDSTCLHDFILENIDIQLEEEGIVSEFDNFVTSCVKILPIHTPHSADSFPYRISPDDVHSLIYSVQMGPARFLSAEDKHHLRPLFQAEHHPVNLNLPPPISISNITSAFQHQKIGILSIEDTRSTVPDGYSSSATVVDRVHPNDSSSWSEKAHGTRALPLKNHHLPGFENSPRNTMQQPTGSNYLLTVKIRGRVITNPPGTSNQAHSTGPISASWSSLLSHRDFSNSSSLELLRQSSQDRCPNIDLVGWTAELKNFHALAYGVHQSEMKSPPCGLVAGSQRHSASNLMHTIQELSRFQMKNTSTTSERSLTKKELSPIVVGSDEKLLQVVQGPGRTSLPGSPTSASLSALDSGRRFFSNPRSWTTGNGSTFAISKTRSTEHGPSIPGKKSTGAQPRIGETDRLLLPVPTGRRLSLKDQQTKVVTKESSPSDVGEMVVHAKLSSSTDHDRRHRFRCLEEFSLEILVFNRSVIDRSLQGPFQFRLLANFRKLLDRSAHLAGLTLTPPLRSHRVGFNKYLPDQLHSGIVSIDEFLPVGPLAMGECQMGKIRLVGLKPGIFQLDGIQIVYDDQPDKPKRPPAVIVDPLVILIE